MHQEVQSTSEGRYSAFHKQLDALRALTRASYCIIKLYFMGKLIEHNVRQIKESGYFTTRVPLRFLRHTLLSVLIIQKHVFCPIFKVLFMMIFGFFNI